MLATSGPDTPKRAGIQLAREKRKQNQVHEKEIKKSREQNAKMSAAKRQINRLSAQLVEKSAQPMTDLPSPPSNPRQKYDDKAIGAYRNCDKGRYSW